jgi:transposase InsO family protein
MRLHGNAKTTPSTRALMVRRVQRETWSVEDTAAAAGVSPRTVYKWLARYRAEGPRGLEDRSSAPRRVPHRTPARRVHQIERLRRRRWTGWRIAERLRMALSTVSAILRRLGLGRLRNLDPPRPVQRYERATPGELLHIDVKKLGRFRKMGHRVTGRLHDRNRGIGWEYVYVCVDDATRLAYVEVLPNEQASTAVGFLERAVAGYRAQGIRIQRVMTDNGSPFVSRRFALRCGSLRIRHLRTRPYRPRTNGKAERFIQTLIREWAYGRAYRSSAGRRRALPAWLRYYNHRRPHRSLGMRPPISRLQSAA